MVMVAMGMVITATMARKGSQRWMSQFCMNVGEVLEIDKSCITEKAKNMEKNAGLVGALECHHQTRERARLKPLLLLNLLNRTAET